MPAKWDATFPRTATTASQSRVSQPPRETLAKHRPASVQNRQIRASRVTIERDAQRDTPFDTHTETVAVSADSHRAMKGGGPSGAGGASGTAACVAGGLPGSTTTRVPILTRL